MRSRYARARAHGAIKTLRAPRIPLDHDFKSCASRPLILMRIRIALLSGADVRFEARRVACVRKGDHTEARIRGRFFGNKVEES